MHAWITLLLFIASDGNELIISAIRKTIA